MSIQLDATNINISSTNLTWNGQPIGGSGGVENPMLADLDCGGRDLTNIGNTADTSADLINQIYDSTDRTFNIIAVSRGVDTTFKGSLIVNSGSIISNGCRISGANTDFFSRVNMNEVINHLKTTNLYGPTNVYGNLVVASADPFLENTSVEIVLGQSGQFSLQKINGIGIDNVLTITDLLKIDAWLNLNLNNHSLDNCRAINNLSPIGGKCSKITTTDLSGLRQTAEMFGNNFATDYVGNLNFPALTLKPGDTFSLKMSGAITSSNNDRLSILGASNFGVTGQAVLFELNPIVVDAGSGSYWELEAEITIRSVGTNGTFLTSGNFQQFPDLSQTSNAVAGSGFTTTEVIDTTINNLWSVRYTGNIQALSCVQAVLTKLY